MLQGMSDPVITAAQDAMQHRIIDGSVSDHTKNASAIGKAWLEACWNLDPNRFQIEVSVHPSLNQRIDLLDSANMVAYELKVSGKNANSEFYKDVVKVILWNEQHDNKIGRLVFITEEFGKRYLETPMPQAFSAYLGRGGLVVDVAYVGVPGVADTAADGA